MIRAFRLLALTRSMWCVLPLISVSCHSCFVCSVRFVERRDCFVEFIVSRDRECSGADNPHRPTILSRRHYPAKSCWPFVCKQPQSNLLLDDRMHLLFSFVFQNGMTPLMRACSLPSMHEVIMEMLHSPRMDAACLNQISKVQHLETVFHLFSISLCVCRTEIVH